MDEPLVDRLVRRDRTVALVSLALIVALSWGYIVLMARDMNAAPMAEMPGMDMPMATAAAESWGAARYWMTFTMWAVMMVAMMLPAAAPVILLYARVGRSAAAQNKVFAPTAYFLVGYLAAWTGFSLLATTGQYLLTQAALMTPDMSFTAPTLGAGLLVAAGLYQWTPLKNACLQRCRAPLAFVQAHGGFKPDAGHSVRLGVLHGLYCIGCCWLLMALLFVGGVMNLLWVAGLAVLVLAEKNLPGGAWIGRISGAAFVGAGIWMMFAH